MDIGLEAIDRIAPATAEANKAVHIEAEFLRTVASFQYADLPANVGVFATFLNANAPRLTAQERAFYEAELGLLQVVCAPRTVGNRKAFFRTLRKSCKAAHCPEYRDLSVAFEEHLAAPADEAAFEGLWAELLQLSAVGHCHLFHAAALALWRQSLERRQTEPGVVIAQDFYNHLNRLEHSLGAPTRARLRPLPSRLRAAVAELASRQPATDGLGATLLG